ncbi:hypothetical protein WOLCODRAFT_136549 [Wolfiporia cocos MD-104 SS10]|uniref:Uncharacterized protein n=1 Tax=Wolfiporia cocos (strain MD-104) TaxID=742152 RepID=A0A2H3JQ80_WOLCO|nr:hypothetical protein WOLCODRAFT_136549 [Wolfiporia cocos MD-104 SS10]
MSHPVIRFPPPPPTRNELTAAQRAQLMRSNKKLGQLLGSTPHVLDTHPVSSSSLRVEIPARRSNEKPHRKFWGGHKRSKSSPLGDDSESNNSSSPRSSTSTAPRSSTEGRASAATLNSEQAWRTPYRPTARPPLLKLHPAGPSSKPKSKPEPLRNDAEADISTGLPDSPSAPAFNITSESAMRRKKMQRLQRKLGEGVPVELVFPTAADGGVDDADSSSSDNDETPLLETPSSAQQLPFSLPTIHEERAPMRRTSITAGKNLRPSSPEAMYIASTLEEHGFEKLCIGVPPAAGDVGGSKRPSGKMRRDKELVCVGVSASAGIGGRGRSRRWVQGPVPFDQVQGSWGGRM